MFGFIKKIFIGQSSSDDEKDIVTDNKKSKFVVEDFINKSGFYVHETPKLAYKENIMSRHLEMPDNINNTQYEVIDRETGKVTMIDSSSAQNHMVQVPPGVAVPGIGIVGGSPQRQRPQSQPQRQQPQHQQPQHQQPQHQQPQYRQDARQQPQYAEDDIYDDMNGGQQHFETVSAQRPRPSTPKKQDYFPYSEMASVEDAYHLWVDLAGIRKENMRVSYANGSLTISGTRESNVDVLRFELSDNEIVKPKSKRDPIIQESTSVPSFLMGDFSFTYPFKKLIDETAIKAAFNDGVLYVTMPHRIVGDEIAIAIM